MAKALYVTYHPRARKLFRIFKNEFGIDTIFKKTQTLEDTVLKKGRQIEKGYKKNIVYSIPCGECPKRYVGQTTATLNKRNSQHKTGVRKNTKRQS